MTGGAIQLAASERIDPSTLQLDRARLETPGNAGAPPSKRGHRDEQPERPRRLLPEHAGSSASRGRELRAAWTTPLALHRNGSLRCHAEGDRAIAIGAQHVRGNLDVSGHHFGSWKMKLVAPAE